MFVMVARSEEAEARRVYCKPHEIFCFKAFVTEKSSKISFVDSRTEVVLLSVRTLSRTGLISKGKLKVSGNGQVNLSRRETGDPPSTRYSEDRSLESHLPSLYRTMVRMPSLSA